MRVSECLDRAPARGTEVSPAADDEGRVLTRGLAAGDGSDFGADSDPSRG